MIRVFSGFYGLSGSGFRGLGFRVSGTISSRCAFTASGCPLMSSGLKGSESSYTGLLSNQDAFCNNVECYGTCKLLPKSTKLFIIDPS